MEFEFIFFSLSLSLSLLTAVSAVSAATVLYLLDHACSIAAHPCAATYPAVLAAAACGVLPALPAVA